MSFLCAQQLTRRPAMPPAVRPARPTQRHNPMMQACLAELRQLAAAHGREWDVELRHVERVKWWVGHWGGGWGGRGAVCLGAGYIPVAALHVIWC